MRVFIIFALCFLSLKSVAVANYQSVEVATSFIVYKCNMDAPRSCITNGSKDKKNITIQLDPVYNSDNSIAFYSGKWLDGYVMDGQYFGVWGGVFYKPAEDTWYFNLQIDQQDQQTMHDDIIGFTQLKVKDPSQINELMVSGKNYWVGSIRYAPQIFFGPKQN